MKVETEALGLSGRDMMYFLALVFVTNFNSSSEGFPIFKLKLTAKKREKMLIKATQLVNDQFDLLDVVLSLEQDLSSQKLSKGTS